MRFDKVKLENIIFFPIFPKFGHFEMENLITKCEISGDIHKVHSLVKRLTLCLMKLKLQ